MKKTKRVCIVMPTYNEAQNIKSIINLTLKTNKSQSYVLDMLIVDDNSPDGTGKIVTSLKKKNIHLLTRTKKEGLGAAYIAGMQHAMKTLKPDVIIEMDADFSHDPKVIPSMIKKIDEGYDFVIGSRYVQGGKTAENWGLHRKIISATANFVTTTLLGVKDVLDMSGGFRAMRVSVLKKVGLKHFTVKGYAFQAVLLESFAHQKAKIVEVPITFMDRVQGESKMGMREYFEGFSAFTKVRAGRILGKIL